MGGEGEDWREDQRRRNATQCQPASQELAEVRAGGCWMLEVEVEWSGGAAAERVEVRWCKSESGLAVAQGWFGTK